MAELKNSYKQILKNNPLFENVGERVFETIVSKFELLDFKDGETICGGSCDNRALYFVLEGKAVAKNVGEGKNIILNTFEAGSIIGQASLFRGESRALFTDIYAKKSCVVLKCTEENFTEIIRSSPELSINYIRMLSEKIRFLNGKINGFNAENIDERLFRYLVRSSSANGGKGEKLNATNLAKKIGVGRASVYRALENLTNSGKIEIVDKIIYTKENKNEKETH